METTVVESAAQLAEIGAESFCDTACKAVAARGRFAAALSGGSTPRGMHRLLAKEPYRSKIPWSQVHLFWVDERLVPADDPASNYGTARRDLLQRAPIPPAHVHPMMLSATPQSAAAAYRKQLSDFFGHTAGDFPVFDLITLGMGTDGHTASLFPGDRKALETQAWVLAVKGGDPCVDRLTLSAPVLNHARSVVFLVSGSDKAEVVKTVLTDKSTGLPASLIRPGKGRLRWILDQAAAALLPP